MQIIRKLLDAQNNFVKNSKIVYNPRIVVKSRKNIFKIGKYVLSSAACASSQPALDVFLPFRFISRIRFPQNGGVLCFVWL